MSRFLFAVWSFETHVNPFLAVAAALRNCGHEVAFYAGPRASLEIEAEGFPIFPFQALDERIADAQVAGIVGIRRQPRRLARQWFEFLISQLPAQVADLDVLLQSWKPDVLVSDMAMLAPFTILHDLRGISVAVLSHVGYCMVPGPQGPIPGRAFPPRRSLPQHFRACLAGTIAKFLTRDVPRAVDDFRRTLGLEATGLRVTEYHARVPLLLIPSVPELDYARSDLPSSVHYTGQCLWPPPRVFDPAGQSGEAVILVDEGSLYSQEPILLRSAARAFDRSPYCVRIIAGRHRNQGELHLQASNHVTVSRWRPQEEMMAGVQLVITNGNTESVLSALAKAIPVVVVPAILDQSELAWRVRLFGAGDFIPEAQCTPQKLRETADAVLSDPGYRERAQLAAQHLARYSGPAEAARLLAELASR